MTTPLRPRPVGLPARLPPGFPPPAMPRYRWTPPGERRRPVTFSRAGSLVNALRTGVLLAALGGLLVLVGSLFGRLGALAGLLLGLAVAGGSYWFSDRLALRAAGAVPVGPHEAPELHRIVAELSADAGLPCPRLYLTPDRQPNAFATGRDPRHAAIAVTGGLLELLTPQELRAVLAHELAHVGHRDVLLTSVAAALATGITYLAHLAGWLPVLGGTDDEDEPGPLAVLVAALVAPVAALLLQLALSRGREFEADRAGAALVGSGHPLATALAKIEYAATRIPMAVEPARAPLYVVHPLAAHGGGLAALFRTHPPTVARIARLTGAR